MGLFDWLGRRSEPSAAPAWDLRREDGEIVLELGKKMYRFSMRGAQSVRIVPLGGAGQHGSSGRPGWQVAVRKDDGDVPMGPPLPSWQHAKDLATELCSTSGLPLDELTQRLFSRVGSYPPPGTDQQVPDR